jgi:hypothetical protein
MIIVAHRRNTQAELQSTPTQYGVEVDIRTQGDRLIVAHDPFIQGEDLRDWIRAYRHALLILNVKEEGLESALLELMRERGIAQFFFLDQSFPFLVRTARQGEKRCAVRVSEFESVDTALALAGLVDWVWVDCFTRFPLSAGDAARLRAAGMKLCLVSPELQGRHDPQELADLRHRLRTMDANIAAVCTKYPDRWQ